MRVIIYIAMLIAMNITGFSGFSMASQADYCRQQQPTFASCDNHIPAYHTVLVAVHGWNGSCATTFGEDKITKGGIPIAESLFSIVNESRWFDFDCFEYKQQSKSLNVDQNVKNLAAQIKKLESRGYNQIAFVTHSTGGILVMDYLVRRLNRSVDENKYDNTQYPVVINWSVPINGLRWQINFSGKLLNFFGFDQKTLPDLNDSGSPYLKDLRDNLAEYQKILLNNIGVKIFAMKGINII